MKLDATVMRTMERRDFTVLAAVEEGMRHHEWVPSALVASLAKLRHGGTSKFMSRLLRDKLLSHDRKCGYDGYRLTNSGFDILALHNLKVRHMICALGDRVGTGKESDVYVAATPTGGQVILKIHRLGRTSFRNVKNKRDYFMVNQASSSKNGTTTKSQPNSWLFLSRISALKEYAFMKALHEVDYPTPKPLAHNRHVVCMSLVRGVPLYQLPSSKVSAAQAQSIFSQSLKVASRLASNGLVHCDLNEFNLLVDMSGVQSVKNHQDEDDAAQHYVRHSGMSVATKGHLSAHVAISGASVVDGTGEIVTEEAAEPAVFLENGEPQPVLTLIDFPQMVSTRHPNAKELYDRDMTCLRKFFTTKLKCNVDEDEWDELIPSFESVTSAAAAAAAAAEPEVATTSLASRAQVRLDEDLCASGFSKEDANRDQQLYYYESHQNQILGLEPVNDDEDEESNSDISNHIEEADEDGGNSEVVAVEENVEEEEEHEEKDDDEVGSLGGDDDEKNSKQVVVLGGPMNGEMLDLRNNEDARTVLTRQSWAVAEEKARARVQQHLEARKAKGGRKQAFRTKNSNKTYVKGKRVMNDSLDY